MSRNEQIKTERRRRNADGLAGKRRRLTVDESKLDREKYEYRFANDENNRIHELTVKDDWEVVSDRGGEVKGNSSNMGANVSVVAGTGEKGNPVNAVLLRKPKSYYDEDAAKAQRHIDAKERSIAGGEAPGSDSGSTYVPTDGIKIESGATT